MSTDLIMPTTGRQAPWEAVRLWVLDRDGHVCSLCGDEANEVDHIWPRRLGGNDHSDNLQALCGPCNKRKGDRVDLFAASSEQLLAASEALGRRVERLIAELYEVTHAAFEIDNGDGADDLWPTMNLDSVISGLLLQRAQLALVIRVATNGRDAIRNERGLGTPDGDGAA